MKIRLSQSANDTPFAERALFLISSHAVVTTAIASSSAAGDAVAAIAGPSAVASDEPAQ